MSESMIVGVDHGYAAMKTAHFSFPSGLVAYEHEPYTLKDVLEYGGKFYVVGSGRQAEGADAIAQSFRTHGYVQTDSAATIADGIAVKVPGDLTVPLIERYADDVVTVSDRDISEAVLLLMERCKQIVEPAGATPVAAVLKGKVDVKGKNVVCLLSGGNIDVSFIQCIIEQGLVARSRRLRFTVTLLDRPGSLGKLLNDIAALGANILSVEHDRLTAGLNPNEIDVHVSCEVGDKAHGDRVRGQLIQSGYHVKID